MIKRLMFILITICFIAFVSVIVVQSKRSEIDYKRSMTKLFNRTAIQNQAREMARSGRYDQAIELYRKASQLEYINNENDKAHTIGPVADILKYQQKYEEALAEYQWFLRHPEPAESALEEVAEIKALMHYRDTGDKEQVLSHIQMLKENHKKDLPPIGFFSSNFMIADILRLYDTIGELDAGILFIDTCMEFFKKQDMQRYGEYRPGKADQAYEKVRLAFEQDKRDGTKGRATKALIESRYFPW